MPDGVSELLLGPCCGENVHLCRLPRLVAHLEKQVATKRDQGNSGFLPPILHLRTLVIELPGRSPLSCCAWLLPSQVMRKNEIHLGCSNVYDNREGKNLPEGPSATPAPTAISKQMASGWTGFEFQILVFPHLLYIHQWNVFSLRNVKSCKYRASTVYRGFSNTVSPGFI